MSVTVAPTEIARFVSAVFRYADEGTWISLRIFDEHRKDVLPVIEPVRMNGDISKLSDAATRMAEIAARRSRPSVFAPPVATFTNANHAREEDLACALALCVELDMEAQQGLETLRGLIGQPTVVVTSGGTWRNEAGRAGPKLHVYWRYSEAAVGEDIARSKILRTAATQLVGGDPTNYPDSHPIRWPGSVHRKAEPKLARIYEMNEDAEIHLSEALDIVDTACRQAGKRVQVTTAVRSRPVVGSNVSAAKFSALLENSREFKRAWNEGYKKDSGIPDHSKCDWWLALDAARAGWSDEEIAALISEFRHKVGEGNEATPGYLGHTIGKARHFLSSGQTVVDDGLYLAERAVEEGDSDGAIRALGNRLGIPLSKMMITGIDTAVAYWFVLDDSRRVGLGDASGLLKQIKVRERVLAAVGVVMNTVKQREWDAVIRMMIAVAEREEAADSDPVKALMDVLGEYLDKHKPVSWDAGETDTSFLRNMPVLKDEQPWITVRHFHNWCLIKGGMGALKAEELRGTLREAGWIGEKLTRRTGGKVVGRFYWHQIGPGVGGGDGLLH